MVQTDNLKESNTKVDGGSKQRKALSTELAMGGQAVLEGVMMRSPDRVAIAVRTPGGDIDLKSYPYIPIIRRFKCLGLPIVRGAVSMFEAMKIGIEALNWSAEKAMSEEEKAKLSSRREKLSLAFTTVLSLGAALLIFMYVPYLLSRLAVGADANQVKFHLIAGAVRIALLVLYMAVIARFKDIHRIFQYHGSEHKSIYTFERGIDLKPENVLKQSRFHPRCGTSFILIVALAAIAFFAVIDSVVLAIWGPYSGVWVRLAVHIPLIPVVAGVSYELLKLSAKRADNRLVRALIQPGLWLQRITTQEPDSEMCEVALTALNAALNDGKNEVKEAVSASKTAAETV